MFTYTFCNLRNRKESKSNYDQPVIAILLSDPVTSPSIQLKCIKLIVDKIQ